MTGQFDFMNNEDWYKANRYMNTTLFVGVLFNLVAIAVLVSIKLQ